MSPDDMNHSTSLAQASACASVPGLFIQYGLHEWCQVEFKRLLACNRIPLTTFYSDTYLDKDLSRLPQKRARLYQSFFQDLNWEELVPVSKPSSVVQREQKQEKQKTLAKRPGMKLS